MSAGPPVPLTYEARVAAVATALLDLDGRPHDGPHAGAAFVEAQRLVLALAVLATLEREAAQAAQPMPPMAPRKRRAPRKSDRVEH